MKKFLVVALALIVSPFIRIWDKIDRRMCVSLPTRQRLWWCKLWDRKDEFHPCYRLDTDIMRYLDPEKADEYYIDLITRRNRAHEREVDPPLLQ